MLTTRRFNKILLTVFFALGLCLLMIATAGAQSLILTTDFHTGFPLTGVDIKQLLVKVVISVEYLKELQEIVMDVTMDQ